MSTKGSHEHFVHDNMPCATSQIAGASATVVITAVVASTVVVAGVSVASCFILRKWSKKRKDAASRRLPPTRPWPKKLQHAQPGVGSLPVSLTSLDIMVGTKVFTLKNRFVRAAAFAGATIEDLTKLHCEVAAGGVAMTTVAYASVSREGCTFRTQLVLQEDEQRGNCNIREQLVGFTSAVHAASPGIKVAVQLTHGGGFADPSMSPHGCAVGPSRMFQPASLSFCKEMDERDLQRVAEDFASAALLARDCGFDAVELHCGHGYLLSQFLSPACNVRTDAYGPGGDRSAYPVHVLACVRAAVGGDFPIIVKTNVVDGFQGGLTVPQACDAAVALARGGADALVLSKGFVSKNSFAMLTGPVPRLSMIKNIPGITKKIGLALLGKWLVPSIRFQEGFIVADGREVIKAVRNAGFVELPICALGGLSSLSAVEGALARIDVDADVDIDLGVDVDGGEGGKTVDGYSFVQMARALIREPNFVQRIQMTVNDSEMNPGGIDSGGINSRVHICDGIGGSSGEGDEKGPGNDEDGVVDVVSLCTHCNECVVATLDPSRVMTCIELQPKKGLNRAYDW